MQLFALENERLIDHRHAEKEKNYFCPECRSIVRFKKGKKRQPHFFHLKSQRSCRLAQKSEEHLALQKFLQKMLEEEGAQMEFRFPSIGRIADLVCLKTKKIFEIQCSPISLEEAELRCRDYQNLGFHIIWILHEKRYNKRKVSLAEQFLRATTTTYFSNMNEQGIGTIYDQWEQIANHRRLKKSSPLLVNLQKSLSILSSRQLPWPLSHEGDVVDRSSKGWIKPWEQKRKKFFHSPQFLKNFYVIHFRRLLEKASK